MAEVNESRLTPFGQELIDTKNQIFELKEAAEANIVSSIYQKPELLPGSDLKLEDFSHNEWKVFFAIAQDLILNEKKSTLDDMTIAFYLEKHPKLQQKYEEYGGYDTLVGSVQYVNSENMPGYIIELKKWNALLKLAEYGFPIRENLSKFVDLPAEAIYNVYETRLNHVFSNSVADTKAHDIFDGMPKFVDELNEGNEAGIPFDNAHVLTDVVGGFNVNGNIYGLGAASGVGKSTMAFNYLLPMAIHHHEKIVFIINEEDERKFKKDLLIWVCNNVFKKTIQKKVLRRGHFTAEEFETLRQAAQWIEDKHKECQVFVIPLEKYSARIAIKQIRKYASMYGVRIFVLDTLKESFDAASDEIYKSMMRDMVELYDAIKPRALNVGLFVTYQLGKSSIKMRHLTNNEIGQAKSILDVMSVNLMMRRFFEDEYEGEKKAVKCYKIEKDCTYSTRTLVEYLPKREDHLMITFVAKNRFGETGKQIVSKCDLSTNVCHDIGYCIVPEDF